MATHRRKQTELFAAEIAPAEPVPKAVEDELRTLLAMLLLGAARNRSAIPPTTEVCDDQDHG